MRVCTWHCMPWDTCRDVHVRPGALAHEGTIVSDACPGVSRLHELTCCNTVVPASR